LFGAAKGQASDHACELKAVTLVPALQKTARLLLKTGAPMTTNNPFDSQPPRRLPGLPEKDSQHDYLYALFDPFIATAYLRQGAFGGMARRDWKIFLLSWLIANA